MDQRNLKIAKWTARIVAFLVLVMGLPFYFGYGNPLPFIDSEYTLFDNVWLSIFPIMFIGLLIGWKYEKTGGYLVAGSLVIGFIMSLIMGEDFSPHMLIPFMVGILYLIVGYKKQSQRV